MSLISKPPRSVCILRLSAIGDVCHAVAVVQALQRHWPQTRITWIIGKAEAALLAGLPGIDFVVYDKKGGWQSWWRLRQQLRHQSFDLLLHMQVALRASLVSLAVTAQTRMGFCRSRAREGQWLFTNAEAAIPSGMHVQDGFAAFLTALGIPFDAPLWQMPLTPELQHWAATQHGHQPLVVICPSASKAERNWLPERYAALAAHAVSRGYEVVLAGGPSAAEKALAQTIIDACPVPLVNKVGQTTLKQLLALIAQARLVIGPDSGPLHMAATVGTPALGLYAHSNPRRTGPLAPESRVVSVYDAVLAEQTGSGEGHRWGKRNRGAELMARISVEAVTACFDEMMPAP